MDTLLERTSTDERQELFAATAARMGIAEQIIEKDFWVCWTLRRLFTMPGICEHLTFKGGTSLSKAYGLIDRFSEDIDITIERSWLEVPNQPTGSARQWLNKIKAACRRAVADQIVPALQKELKLRIKGDLGILIVMQKSDEDPRKVLFQYPTVLKPLNVEPIHKYVTMEFSARSEVEPSNDRSISPYVAREFPHVVPEAEIKVRCLAAERTFFEKATLLHEEIRRPATQAVNKLSRHYYDLIQMMERGVEKKALDNIVLYGHVVTHRSQFFKNHWMGDYAEMHRGPLTLIPTSDRIEAWRLDYKKMEQMFFKPAPSFDDLLERARGLADRINTARGIGH